ncbi:MAG: hypothetical protein HQL68_11160 [Magnetococcales bacterium]|nr:hypothetical protein [Magnetococcales bacterium]
MRQPRLTQVLELLGSLIARSRCMQWSLLNVLVARCTVCARWERGMARLPAVPHYGTEDRPAQVPLPRHF